LIEGKFDEIRGRSSSVVVSWLVLVSAEELDGGEALDTVSGTSVLRECKSLIYLIYSISIHIDSSDSDNTFE
jgi:hypothetical protein